MPVSDWNPRVVGTAAAALFVTAVNYPQHTAAVTGTVAAGLVYRRVRRHGVSQIDRLFIRPTLEVLRETLPGVGITLKVNRKMRPRVSRPARRMGRLEKDVRHRYGLHVEPVVTWPAVQAGKAWVALVGWVTPALDYALPPRKGARIELTLSKGYLTPEQKGIVSSIINTKIPISDSIEQWSMIGRTTRAVWTIARRPPARVTLADVLTRIDSLPEDRYALGLGSGREIVTVSLDLDSPHICLSARSGSGKSNTVALVAGQVLRRGGRVVMLDLKGSHPELKDLVDYCITAEQCHNALIKAAEEAQQRNLLAFHEPGADWQRVLVVAEEMNLMIPALRDYWAANRGKGDPNVSPAIAALRALSAAGRSAKYHLLAVAQYLSANAAGGPESRENFGAKLLSRPSSNMWKALCGIGMPRISSIKGRSYLVVDDEVEEVQVAYLRPGDVTLLAKAPLMGVSSDVTGCTPLGERLTLREAVDGGVFGGSSFAAVKARWHRSSDRPPAVAKRGQADLYSQADLRVWAAANPGTGSERVA